MTLLTRPKDPARLAWSDVENLGKAGAWEWVRYPKGDGDYWFLERGPMESADVARPLRNKDEIRISEKSERIEDGTRMIGVVTRRAHRADPGAFEHVRRGRTKRPEDTRLRPLDLTNIYPALQARSPEVVVGPSQPLDLLAGALAADFHGDKAKMVTHGMVLPGRPAVAGARAVYEFAVSKGAQLLVARTGKVLLLFPGGRPVPGVLEAVAMQERLLPAFINQTKQVACEVDHSGCMGEAFAVVPTDVAICEALYVEGLQP